MTANLALAGMRITAAWLNLNIAGPWVAITPQNSWTNVGGGNATFQARLRDSVTVEVVGLIKSPSAGSATSVQIGVLPAGMIPADTQALQSQVEGTAPVTLGCYATFSTGAISLYGTWANAVNVAISGLISLDA